MNSKYLNLLSVVFIFAIFMLAVGFGYPQLAIGDGSGEVTQAIAVLHPTQGNDVMGTVRFSQMMDKVKVTADISGLSPGKHGFHIHQFGDCTAADGKSAGGHYNPTGQPHAGPDQKMRHMGDLGNVEADASGKAHYERLDSHLMLNGRDTIIGRGVIVHGGADDLTSQPSGDAGPRVACGVIGIAKP
jgi:Cu-Zn family superoxide dismutase